MCRQTARNDFSPYSPYFYICQGTWTWVRCSPGCGLKSASLTDIKKNKLITLI